MDCCHEQYTDVLCDEGGSAEPPPFIMRKITETDRLFFLLGVNVGEGNQKAAMVELAKLAEPGRGGKQDGKTPAASLRNKIPPSPKQKLHKYSVQEKKPLANLCPLAE